jgi:hypothetical protein
MSRRDWNTELVLSNLVDWLENVPILIEKPLTDKPIDEPELETVDETFIDTNSLVYQMLINLDGKTGIWTPRKFIKSDSNIVYPIANYGDYILNCRIKLDRSENLNEFLESHVALDISGTTIFGCSMRFITILTEKITNQKITHNDEYYIIPMCIFRLIGNKYFAQQMFTDYRMTIYNSKVDPEKCIFQTEDGFSNCTNREVLTKTQMHTILVSSTQNFTVDDYITEHTCDLVMYNMGIIVWYTVDATDTFGEAQLIQPVILKAELIFSTGSKVFDLHEIETVKSHKHTGFIIPTNRYNFAEFVESAKNKSHTPIPTEHLINWSHLPRPTLKIHWSNYQPGAKFVIEQYSYNRLLTADGMQVVRYT